MTAPAHNSSKWLQHFTKSEYDELLAGGQFPSETMTEKRLGRKDAIARWPDLAEWSDRPLIDRLVHWPVGATDHHRQRISAQRFYMCALAMDGRLKLDYPWLVVHPFADLAHRSGVPLGFGPRWLDVPAKEAERVGYAPNVARRSLQWACVRMALAHSESQWEMIDGARIEQLREQIIAVGQRPDLDQVRAPTVKSDRANWLRTTRTYPHVVHVVLHALSVIDQGPRIISQRLPQQHALPKATAEMEQIIDRYLDRTVPNRDRVRGNVRGRLHTFTAWLARHHPDVTSFSQLTREHLEHFMTWVNTDYHHYRTGAPVSIETRRATISVLNVFLRKTLAWEWDGIPDRPLLSHLDLPKTIERVPRYLPADQLAAIEEQIRLLTDPYQRAANLIARWVGPRRSEIRRLELDCLDTYPDGHPRLRIPAGKTYTERVVPLHPEAADALRECINATRSREQRPLIDDVTGRPTSYVFQIRGRLMSGYRLFDSALQAACDNAGLIDHSGGKLVTSHRFRHTVGTQLAEQGARLQTIMSILGHSSSTMSLIYARITDTTVLQDYKHALKPGARIAGPAATALRNNELPQTTIDWLQSNYYKTALELGHCLRLPEEGPCECDLYLSCSKFLTTAEYAPRLNDRLCLEHTLAQDATTRGWLREAERHNAIAARLQTLLSQLDSVGDRSETGALPATDHERDN